MASLHRPAASTPASSAGAPAARGAGARPGTASSGPGARSAGGARQQQAASVDQSSHEDPHDLGQERATNYRPWTAEVRGVRLLVPSRIAVVVTDSRARLGLRVVGPLRLTSMPPYKRLTRNLISSGLI